MTVRGAFLRVPSGPGERPVPMMSEVSGEGHQGRGVLISFWHSYALSRHNQVAPEKLDNV
jgi:hypothetical protein